MSFVLIGGYIDYSWCKSHQWERFSDDVTNPLNQRAYCTVCGQPATLEVLDA